MVYISPRLEGVVEVNLMANHTRMSSRPEKWRRGSTNFKKIEPCQEIVEQAANETVYREGCMKQQRTLRGSID